MPFASQVKDERDKVIVQCYLQSFLEFVVIDTTYWVFNFVLVFPVSFLLKLSLFLSVSVVVAMTQRCHAVVFVTTCCGVARGFYWRGYNLVLLSCREVYLKLVNTKTCKQHSYIQCT